MIEAYWWKRFPNFGDTLNPLLLRWLSGQPVRWSRAANRPVLTAIGSVVQSAKPAWHVWGSGLIAAHGPVAIDLTVHAVRGPRTRSALASHGYRADIPLGDPALLLPLLFPARPDPAFEWGIIPHYIDYPVFAALFLSERLRSGPTSRRRVVLINPFSHPRAYVQRLTACRHVASSSLHGLIAADAWGIPNVWFATGPNPLKDFCLKHTTFIHDHFKYYDYFDSVSRAPDAPTLVTGQIQWDEWQDKVRTWAPIRWDPVPLLEAFPFKGKEWTVVIQQAVRRFQSCSKA